MLPAVVIALGSAVLFGLSTPVAKLLLGETDPWMLAGLLYGGAGVGLLAVHLARRALGGAEAHLARGDLPWLAGAVVSGGIVGPVL
ncbi:MAG: EamA family transporter, partial [Reyranella sp.]